jgi:methylenetetrahydrofolate dehydrogenase (NADP+) / methenyltetrahydrofolate cyclohydrolase
MNVYSLTIPMTAKILAAQPLVDEIKKDLKLRCDNLKSHGVNPTMYVILVGDNPASLSYIRNKKRICEEVGATFHLLQLPTSISEADFLSEINRLNSDASVHGIIIQLPVTDHLKKLDLPNLVIPAKDIDGFHGENTQSIYKGTTDLRSNLLPCTPKGIIQLLKFYGVELTGAHAVVLGRSLIVGKPISMLLSNLNATVTLAHSQTRNLESITRTADILVSAIGKTHFVTKNHLDPLMKTVVIDVGMNTLHGKLTGDVAPEVREVAGAITPVPGGVGPMTVVSLIENLITATENQMKG